MFKAILLYKVDPKEEINKATVGGCGGELCLKLYYYIRLTLRKR